MNHFETSTAAASAQALPLMYQMGGVQWPVAQTADAARTASVYVGNLPAEWTQREVQSLLQITGVVQATELRMKECHCYVDFKDTEPAEAAAKKLDNYALNNGVSLSARVQAEDKPRSPVQQVQQHVAPHTTAAPAPQQMLHPGHFGAQAQAQPQAAWFAHGNPQQFAAAGTAAGEQGAASVAAFAPAAGAYQAGWQVNHMPMVQNGAMIVPVHSNQMGALGVQPVQLSPTASTNPSPTPDSSNQSPRKNARKKKGKKSRPSVFVGGIRTDITEREIRNFFGMFGKINHVTIKEGYAFLDFAEDAAARAAVEKCNGYMYDGKPLGVRIQDETNRRTAQEAKKQGQNVSMVFKRIEEEQGVGMPGMAGAQGMPGMQGMPPQQQQQLQQQQLLGGVRPQMPMDVDARATALAP